MKVTAREGKTAWAAFPANEPHFIEGDQLGDPIAFEVANVADIFRGNPSYDRG